MCPRCHKHRFNTFNISRYNKRMPINKCCVCGFLWINDKDLVELTKDEARRLFVETLREMGKGNEQKIDTS